MIVLDASAAVSYLLVDAEARRIAAVEQIAAPHLIDAEVAQTLRHHGLRGLLPAESCVLALDSWCATEIRRYSMLGLLGRMWELRDDVSAYDASYVALAEALDVELVTADARLAAAPGTRCRFRVVGS